MIDWKTMATVTDSGPISRRPGIRGGGRALPGQLVQFAGSLSGVRGLESAQEYLDILHIKAYM
jgi:hypothetical protein